MLIVREPAKAVGEEEVNITALGDTELILVEVGIS